MRPWLLFVLVAAACGGSSAKNPDASSAGSDTAPMIDAPSCTPMAPAPTTLNCPSTVTASSNIQRIVIIIQENHSFDTYFGTYCTAPTGSKPACTTGPACCEAAPTTMGGSSPMVLDDTENGAYDPNHTFDCESREMDGGKMDGYTNAATCGDPRNYAITSSGGPYAARAASGAIADNYFQPVVGQSSSNDMFFATARFEFQDNTKTPASIGSSCELGGHPSTLTDTTIGDLLNTCNVPWAFYAEGYGAMKTAVAGGGCPMRDSGCTSTIDFYPCTYDPSDVPFEYYTSTRDSTHMKDLAQFTTDLAAGTLPPIVYIKFLGYKTEHPGGKTTITNGATAVGAIADAIAGNAGAAASTLVVVTWDEDGGFFDHVSPPPNSTIDCEPYGARVPALALGTFAKQNYVSHSLLEHSSWVKFIEWNWFGEQTGQLGNRDLVVNNVGDLLDPARTGVTVPAN